jgi:hypothetical protein
MNLSFISVTEAPFLQHQELSQLSNHNFTSVTCEKSASSLTLPNTTGFLRKLQFPLVVKVQQCWMKLTFKQRQTESNISQHNVQTRPSMLHATMSNDIGPTCWPN